MNPLRRCTAKAGLKKNVTAHTMRRTFNNLLRQAAGDIAARAMVGHATAQMTEHCSDVTVQEKRDAQRAAFGDLGEQLGGTKWWDQPEIGGTKPPSGLTHKQKSPRFRGLEVGE